jgi:hypothetical protein
MTRSSGTPGLVRCGGNHSGEDLQRGRHGGQHLRQAPVLDGRECPKRTHSLLAGGEPPPYAHAPVRGLSRDAVVQRLVVHQ